MAQNRREFLLWLRRGLIGLGLAGGALTIERLLRPPRVYQLGQRLNLGPTINLTAGARLYFAAQDLHVFHTPRGICAISGRCTHLGCSLKLEPEGFACPCHGARFNLLGMPQSGPAVKPLAWYLIVKDTQGQLWVHLAEQVSPNTWINI